MRARRGLSLVAAGSEGAGVSVSVLMEGRKVRRKLMQSSQTLQFLISFIGMVMRGIQSLHAP
jgi:hypothetical protein